ncbi:response regulator [Emticicia agri]|uniref:Response regulator n=1 Tax=Emticicia agri TaxID=2492393 RepID=A0A4Q5LQQ2_9BACT|nr:response regulator [Emticicia agri]RYU91782.1 response regulator [Emticicia agri]RYU92974.1 response regulator [Emticicia agri]
MPEILKIVLADDDEDDRDFFQEAVQLVKIPVALTTVNNGLELMHLLKISEKFDMIVLDVNMHLKNGIEALVEIQADTKHKDTFCAVLTTASNKHLEEDAIRKGANIFKTKPYNFDEYAANVRTIILACLASRKL